ncbi:MAG: acyltransferase [Pseudomonadota bacterium]
MLSDGLSQTSGRVNNEGSSAIKHQKQRVSLLEAGRGIAALMVVFFHANASSPYFGGPQIAWMRPLEVGVDFFFVLSGYVIMYAHCGDLGQSSLVKRYITNRAIRLFPTLWLVVILAALGQWVLLGTFDVAMFLRSMVPYPSLLEARPQVVWTLRHELLFYSVFALLIVSKRVGMSVVVAWGAGVMVFFLYSLFGNPTNSLIGFAFSTLHLNFLMGALLCLWHQRHPVRSGSLLPLMLGAALLGLWLWGRGQLGLGRLGLSDYSSVGATLGVLITGSVCAVIVHGLVRAESRIQAPNWLLALGASSYVLYLAHTPLNSLAQRVAGHLPPCFLEWGGGHLALILAGVAVSHVLHLYAEKPLLYWLKNRKKAAAH